MPRPLTARVTPDGATSFEATIANLTPSSLFLRAPGALQFRQSVTMELGALTLYGEVAFVCHEPPGAVVVFRPSPDDLHTLEDHMEDIPVVEGGEPWTPLSDEDPTNPAGKALVSHPEPTAEITGRFPPNVSTDVDSKLATVLVQPSLRDPTTAGATVNDPTDVPTVDGPAEAGTFTDQPAGLRIEDASNVGQSATFDKEITDHPLRTKDDTDD